MKNLLKGQILAKYRLDYDKTFTEQSTTVFEKLIPELKRLMEGIFNPSVTQLSNWLRSIHKHKRDRLKKRQTGKLESNDRRLHKNTLLSEVRIYLNKSYSCLLINPIFNRKKVDELKPQ